MRPHGTYARVDPPGMRVRRFRCSVSGCTASRLPSCLAARLGGTLAQAEAVVRAVEEAGEDRPRWRALHPAERYAGQAARWVRRRVRGVRQVLCTLPTLLPERYAGTEASLAGFAARVGPEAAEGRLLEHLRTAAERHLGELPAPVGFRAPRAENAGRGPPARTQHEAEGGSPAAAPETAAD